MSFSIAGRQILKDGLPFSVKGVCYNPTPIGSNGSRAPNGDYFTSAYSALWDRDLPKIRDMGATVIRVYGWAPGADHSAFLARCYNNGDRPIFVLANYWVDPATNWTDARAVKALTANFVNITGRVVNNPAVLGVIIGNEVNSQNGNGWNNNFWQVMNTVAGAVHAADPKRLVSMAITDSMDQLASANSTMTNLDFWCMQLYRGTTFGSAFDDYAARSAKPLIISEWGIDTYDRTTNAPYPDNGAYPAILLGNLWRELSAASATCAGGCVFEYCDEWFRAPGSDTAQDPGGWAAGGFPDGEADEDWFGLFSIKQGPTSINVLTPKASYAVLSNLWKVGVPDVPTPPPTALDGTFEGTRVGTGTYTAFKYDPVLSGWLFEGNAGIAGNASGFTDQNAVAPEGTQVAFIQQKGVASAKFQLAAGRYKVVAKVANRVWGDRQTVVVAVDGVEVGRFSAGTDYVPVSSLAFDATEGAHELRLTGTVETDATLFLDQVGIEAVAPGSGITVGNASFEQPRVGTNNYYAFKGSPDVVPGTQDWSFNGGGGVAGNGSGYTDGNAPAPDGDQVGFVQGRAELSQTLNFPLGGTYKVTLKAAQRGNWNETHMTVDVYIDTARVGTIDPRGKDYESFSITFTVAAGPHTLTLKGTMSSDSTVLVDTVAVTST